MNTTDFKDLGTDSEGFRTLTLAGRVRLTLWCPWSGPKAVHMWQVQDTTSGTTLMNGQHSDRSVAERVGKRASCEALGDLLMDDARRADLEDRTRKGAVTSGAPAKDLPQDSTDAPSAPAGSASDKPDTKRPLRRKSTSTKGKALLAGQTAATYAWSDLLADDDRRERLKQAQTSPQTSETHPNPKASETPTQTPEPLSDAPVSTGATGDIKRPRQRRRTGGSK